MWMLSNRKSDNAREHWQKTFVTLSGFWPLRGWGWQGVWVNPLKKENLKNFTSADVKANIKQQEIKYLVAVSYKFL